MDPIQRAAKDTLAYVESVFVPTHEIVLVNESDYPHLNLKFYRAGRTELERLGFRYLCDEENLTLRNAPGHPFKPAMHRTLLSGDGTITAVLCHEKPRLLSGMLMFVWRIRWRPWVSFVTDLSDGHFLQTSNATQPAVLDIPPMVHVVFLPKVPTISSLHAAHIERLQAYLAENPGVTPLSIESREAKQRSGNRLRALYAAFRGEIPGMTRDELLRAGWGGFTDDVLERIHELRDADSGDAR